MNLLKKLSIALPIMLCFHLVLQAQEPIKLLPHQEIPIEYLIKDTDLKGIVVNHYMGTGKTYLGIGFAEQFKDHSVVILAPGFIESHWQEHLKNFPVKSNSRYRFVSYSDAPQELLGKDLSKTIFIMDEVHNLIKLIKSPDPITNQKYSKLYEQLRGAFKIVALSGTPIYNDEYDLAYLINLVSGKNLMPFNEEQFRIQFTEVKKARSFWRGYVFESNILKQALPLAVGMGSAPLFLVAGAPVAAPVLVVGSLGSILAFPLVNNILAPVETYPLRELEVKKFQPYISKYISFFEIENQDLSDFPSKTIHVQDVSYNTEQFWFFLNFAEKSLGNQGLARLYKDHDANFDQAYLTLNTTILQNRLADTLGAGREIGNFEFVGENTLVEPPKFIDVLNKIRAQGLPKTVIYSNYFENGVMAFARFLDRNGLKDSYELLLPDMSPDKFAAVVRRYNDGKNKIVLLHPEITEGISLKGTRQFHILEPVTNLTIQNQVIARAVRYQSHNMLPASERNVDVYIWKAVIGSMSLQSLKLQKANWFKRYSEMSDWSNFGQGISQIDSNYARKKMSPDAQTYMRLESVNQNMDALKGIMRDHSIEKERTSLGIEDLILLNHKGLELETPQLDPFVLPKTNFRSFWRIGQQIDSGSLLNGSLAVKNHFGLNLEVEIPIWRHLASGFYFETYWGQATKRLQLDLLDLTGDMAREDIGQAAFGIGGFFKPQVKIPVPVGDLALSLRIPFGAEMIFGQALIPLIKDQAELDGFKRSDAAKAVIGYDSAKLGYGLTTGASLGVEYFPFEFAGFVVEGGYQASYHLFPIQIQHQFEKAPSVTTNEGFRGYWMHGWNVTAGLKLTY